MQQNGAGEDNDVAWEWRWGPHAMAEISKTAIAHFIAEFMAAQHDTPLVSPASRVESHD